MPPPGAWEAFDTSTEAGRMLKKLYGNNAGHPNIEYPKLTTRATKPRPRGAFIPGGARAGHSDPRSNSKRREAGATVAAVRRKPQESKRERRADVAAPLLPRRASRAGRFPPSQEHRSRRGREAPPARSVPLQRHARRYRPIDFVARRKREGHITAEMADMRMRTEACGAASWGGPSKRPSARE